MAFNRSSVCICAQTRKNVSTGAAILLIFIFNTTSVVFVFHFKPYTHQFRSCKMSHFKTHDTCFDILYLTQCRSDVFKCLKCTNMCSLLTHISLISILSNLDSDEIKKRANYDFAKVYHVSDSSIGFQQGLNLFSDLLIKQILLSKKSEISILPIKRFSTNSIKNELQRQSLIIHSTPFITISFIISTCYQTYQLSGLYQLSGFCMDYIKLTIKLHKLTFECLGSKSLLLIKASFI